jgi:hypothetical protein
VGALFGDRGLLHLIDQRHRAEALAREVEELEAENAQLATEITALRSDPRAIERWPARSSASCARARPSSSSATPPPPPPDLIPPAPDAGFAHDVPRILLTSRSTPHVE